MKECYLTKEDQRELIGYILYDLFEMGLLNKKGQKIVNNSTLISDDVITPIGNIINKYITEKAQDDYGN